MPPPRRKIQARQTAEESLWPPIPLIPAAQYLRMRMSTERQEYSLSDCGYRDFCTGPGYTCWPNHSQNQRVTFTRAAFSIGGKGQDQQQVDRRERHDAQRPYFWIPVWRVTSL